MIERNRLIDFLMGLNEMYENVRGNIMGMDHLVVEEVLVRMHT